MDVATNGLAGASAPAAVGKCNMQRESNMIQQGPSQKTVGARRHAHRAATMFATLALTLLACAQPASAVPATALRPLSLAADGSAFAAAPLPQRATSSAS